MRYSVDDEQLPDDADYDKHVLMGRDGDDDKGRPTYCGAVRGPFEWVFVDAVHVLCALQDGTGVQPCRACLRTMREVIDAEL